MVDIYVYIYHNYNSMESCSLFNEMTRAETGDDIKGM